MFVLAIYSILFTITFKKWFYRYLKGFDLFYIAVIKGIFQQIRRPLPDRHLEITLTTSLKINEEYMFEESKIS